MMFKPFSKRKNEAKSGIKPSEIYIYEIQSNVRNRILYTLKDSLEKAWYPDLFDQILSEVRDSLLKQYGGIEANQGVIDAGVTDPAIAHFLSCSHERALDWLEFFFRASPGFHGKFCVDPLNAIFQDEGIGYEFTQLVERDAGPGNLFGPPGGRRIEYEYPQAIKKSDQYTHQSIIQPCLHALGGPAYGTAHGEMLKAHEAFRQGDYPGAITSCCSAFESVLKTICAGKGIPCDPQKDPCGVLVQKCLGGNLFPPFYAEAFKASGTIRNNLGSAHGRGPTPAHQVSKEQADHMIQMTSAHITFLVKLAGL
jgi:AbiJ N-terminal domain 4